MTGVFSPLTFGVVSRLGLGIIRCSRPLGWPIEVDGGRHAVWKQKDEERGLVA